MVESSHSAPVFILGMHRSGTSHLASRVQALGVRIGQKLVGAKAGNPRGHFEDEEILDFHEALIAARIVEKDSAFDRSMMVQGNFTSPWTDEEREQAARLVESRDRSGLWGWKEPRTALFIDQWTRMLPGLKGIVIYRHPLAVHDSALRRGHWDLALYPAQVFEAYARYNNGLLTAIERDPESYIVINADSAFSDLHRTDVLLRQFLEVGDSTVDPMPKFYPGEFRSLTLSTDLHRLLGEVCPSAMQAFDRLDAISRIRARPFEPEKTESQPVLSALKQLASSSRENGVGVNTWLIPWIECLVLDREPGECVGLRSQLASEIGIKVRTTEEWNAKAAKVYQDNEWLNREREQLGDRFARQQAFLDKQERDFSRMWQKHKELSAVNLNQAETIRLLEQKIADLENAPTSNPV